MNCQIVRALYRPVLGLCSLWLVPSGTTFAEVPSFSLRIRRGADPTSPTRYLKYQWTMRVVLYRRVDCVRLELLSISGGSVGQRELRFHHFGMKA